MNRFENISILGYRRLVNVHVELRPLTVLIGANGVGKTSFLEVWVLLAAACQGQLSAKLSELGGLNDIITRDRAGSVAFDLTMSVPNHAPLKYRLRIEPQGQSYRIGEESLTQQNRLLPSDPMKHIESYGLDVRYFDVDTNKLLRPNWEHNPLETSLSQVPKMFQEPENFRRRLASCVFYGPLDVSPKAPVRLPQPLRPATLPGVHGEDLVSCLYSLRETDRDRFEVLEDTLRAAFSDFERLDFPPVAAGVLAITWKDSNFSKADVCASTFRRNTAIYVVGDFAVEPRFADGHVD
jgi:predicted ATPase